jgi:hypothetical protein
MLMTDMLRNVEQAAGNAWRQNAGRAFSPIGDDINIATPWWRDLSYLSGVAKIVISIILVFGSVIGWLLGHGIAPEIVGLVGVAMNSVFRDHTDSQTAQRTAAAILTTAPASPQVQSQQGGTHVPGS